MLKVDKKNQTAQKANSAAATAEKKDNGQKKAAPAPRPSKLDTLKVNPNIDKLIDIIERMKQHPDQSQPAKQNASRVSQMGKKVAFVAPLLPHHCELEIWNAVVRETGVSGVIITANQEERSFQTFVETCNLANIPVALTCKALETTLENKSFLGGLENEIRDAEVVVAVGEASLSTYQALKARRSLQN